MGGHNNDSLTQEEKAIIEFQHKYGSFDGHHAHGSHATAKYVAPKTLNNSLTLFALKKLNAMDPNFLTHKEKRLLQAVSPGIISYTLNFGFLASQFGYVIYIWRGFGVRQLLGFKILPVFGLLLAQQVVMRGVNYSRQLLFSRQRKAMAQKYRNQYGDSYILNVLDPNYRIQI